MSRRIQGAKLGANEGANLCRTPKTGANEGANAQDSPLKKTYEALVANPGATL